MESTDGRPEVRGRKPRWVLRTGKEVARGVAGGTFTSIDSVGYYGYDLTDVDLRRTGTVCPCARSGWRTGR